MEMHKSSVKTEIKFIHNTPKNKLQINSRISILLSSVVVTNYEKCSKLCEIGCKNYNLKYSCPPLSPSFQKISAGFNYIVVNSVIVPMNTLRKQYNSVRIANAVSKSIQKKVFDNLRDNSSNKEEIKILANGSCRLCKTCNLKKDVGCKYPNKMSPSLEATGVDVNSLMRTAFGLELQWYSKRLFPNYQCVVGGVLTNDPNKIQTELYNYYSLFYIS